MAMSGVPRGDVPPFAVCRAGLAPLRKCHGRRPHRRGGRPRAGRAHNSGPGFGPMDDRVPQTQHGDRRVSVARARARALCAGGRGRPVLLSRERAATEFGTSFSVHRRATLTQTSTVILRLRPPLLERSHTHHAVASSVVSLRTRCGIAPSADCFADRRRPLAAGSATFRRSWPRPTRMGPDLYSRGGAQRRCSQTQRRSHSRNIPHRGWPPNTR